MSHRSVARVRTRLVNEEGQTKLNKQEARFAMSLKYFWNAAFIWSGVQGERKEYKIQDGETDWGKVTELWMNKPPHL